MNNLGKLSALAVKWTALTTVGRFFMQVFAQIVLARLLGPENYGIFGIGLVVYTFGAFFSNFGFGRELLQKQSVTNNDIRFAFTWSVFTGGGATLILLAVAPWIADYFNEPRALSVIRWLSLACLINATAATASHLIQRDMQFKKVGLIQLFSYLLGYIFVGIPLAILGYGVFSLVAAWLIQSVVVLVAVFFVHRHPIMPLFWHADSREGFLYGGTVFLTNIVNWVITNLDRVIVGRLLNTEAVGFYTVGYNLAVMPNSLLLNSVQTVFLASASRLQDDIPRLRESYIQILSTVVVLIFPAFVFLSMMAPYIVAFLYGEKWQQSGQVLSVLFVGMPALIVCGLSTPILWSNGKARYESLLQLPILVLGAVALFIYAPNGIIAVAVVAVSIFFARAFVIVVFSMLVLDINPIVMVYDFSRGLIFGSMVLVLALLSIDLTSGFSIPLVTMLVAGSVVAVIALVIFMYRPNWLGRGTILMLDRFVNRRKK